MRTLAARRDAGAYGVLMAGELLSGSGRTRSADGPSTIRRRARVAWGRPRLRGPARDRRTGAPPGAKAAGGPPPPPAGGHREPAGTRTDPRLPAARAAGGRPRRTPRAATRRR